MWLTALAALTRAAGEAPSRVAADYYRFQLLTGCRGGEIHGDKRHGYGQRRKV